MTDEERRALLIVGLLMSGASASTGFAGGRMTAPEPQAEVRLVRLPPRIVRVPVEVAPVAPAPAAEIAPAPPPESVPIAETKPEPPAAKPKPRPARTQPRKEAKPRAPIVKALPSCAVVQREYDAMNYAERIAAYYRATPEEIAHGKRCLGL